MDVLAGRLAPPAPGGPARAHEQIAGSLRRLRLPNQAVLTALVYIERFLERLAPGTTGGPAAVQRTLIAALVLACKFHSELAVHNARWCQAFCPWLPAADLALMERQFLGTIRYNLRVQLADMAAAAARWPV